jgi:ABC-type amino acid transport substrate-binding protein
MNTNDLDGIDTGLHIEYALALAPYKANEILYNERLEVDTMIQHLKDGDVDALALDHPQAVY